MYDWLRGELEKCLAEHPRTQWTAITAYAFINWLERTGASPCDDCECKAAYVLQELRRGNFTEVPLPKEKP